MRKLAKPLPGTHWEFDPDREYNGQFPKMQLINTETGKVLGWFYADVWSGRIWQRIKSRQIVKEARACLELEYPLLNEWRVKEQ